MLQEGIAQPGQLAQATLMDIARRPRRRRASALPNLKVTWSAVELDGTHLREMAFGALVSQLSVALRTAQGNERDELVIVDIAPEYEVGSSAIGEVQGHIERAALEAAKRLKIVAPEMRLSLRHQSYDLRCYLGRAKPIDFDA